VERERLELYRLEVVHDGEDALLHLSGVFGTEDDHLHALEVDLDRGRRGHTGRESVGRELTGVVDDEIWLAKVFQFLGRRADEHVVLGVGVGQVKSSQGNKRFPQGGQTHHEQGMVSPGSDDSDLDPVLWVPTCETVKDVDVFTSVEVVDGTLSVDLEGVFAGRQKPSQMCQGSNSPHNA
jgi:hypothetical protein